MPIVYAAEDDSNLTEVVAGTKKIHMGVETLQLLACFASENCVLLKIIKCGIQRSRIYGIWQNSIWEEEWLLKHHQVSLKSSCFLWRRCLSADYTWWVQNSPDIRHSTSRWLIDVVNSQRSTWVSPESHFRFLVQGKEIHDGKSFQTCHAGPSRCLPQRTCVLCHSSAIPGFWRTPRKRPSVLSKLSKSFVFFGLLATPRYLKNKNKKLFLRLWARFLGLMISPVPKQVKAFLAAGQEVGLWHRQVKWLEKPFLKTGRVDVLNCVSKNAKKWLQNGCLNVWNCLNVWKFSWIWKCCSSILQAEIEFKAIPSETKTSKEKVAPRSQEWASMLLGNQNGGMSRGFQAIGFRKTLLDRFSGILRFVCLYDGYV